MQYTYWDSYRLQVKRFFYLLIFANVKTFALILQQIT